MIEIKKLKRIHYIDIISSLNFKLKRIFIVNKDIMKIFSKGHYHKRGNQIIILINGEFNFFFEYDGKKKYYKLKDNRKIILLKSPVWRRYKSLKKNSSFMVLNNMNYKSSGTTYDYESFEKINDK